MNELGWELYFDYHKHIKNLVKHLGWDFLRK